MIWRSRFNTSLQLAPIATRRAAPPAAVTVTTAAPVNAKLKFERDLLARQLAELETTGRKFLCGSPKFERNRAQRADLAARIRALDIKIMEPDCTKIADRSLEDQRTELQAELRRHEQRGAKPSDGANPYRHYRDRRLSLLGRIAELENRIARQDQRKERE